MADKELTAFVVDLNPNAIASHYYLYDVLAAKLLKGLKTDYISVLAFHSPHTEHKLADKGVFPGIQVLCDFETPAYDQLAKLKKSLVPNEDWSDTLSDGFQALIYSLSLFENTKKKVFTRNIVLLTSQDSPLNSLTEEKAEGILKLLQDLSMNLVISVVDLDKLSSRYTQWTSISSSFSKFVIVPSEEANLAARNVPPLRKTRPMPVYKGELRFGSNFKELIELNSYNAKADENALAWSVEVYPASKKDVASLSLHDYILDDGKPIRLERRSHHYMWSKNEEYQRPEYPDEEDVDTKKFDKVDVEVRDLTAGFKFSNFDLIALDEDLKESATLKIFSSFDIFGFIELLAIPHAYLTGETFFVVPEKSVALRGTLNHATFAKTLYDLKTAALTRFVRKQAREVELGCMMPVKIQDGESFSYNFILARLPFKEDEKIGNFPALNDSDAKIKKELTTLMEELIESRTYYDDEKIAPGVLKNYKATMKTSDSAKLPLPQKGLNDKFLVPSPSQVRFQRYLKSVLMKSLDAKDLNEFLQQKDFAKNVLRDKGNFTNFFNITNCLSGSSTLDSEWLEKLSLSTKNICKRIVEELDISFIRKADIKKKKQTKSGELTIAKGYYGADEGDYDAIPDFGF